ncbi:hypothetical protein KFFOFENI_KFFOFENI_02157 [Staphylococcus aureus]|nr:hypothetical protein KFFOFENI_KFFOFENI_02157 [Staphylococcus aureus]
MEQLPQVGFMKSFVLFWKNYVNFKGRSRRSEYWYMMLWHLIFILPAFFVFFMGAVFVGIGDEIDAKVLSMFGVMILILTVSYIYASLFFSNLYSQFGIKRPKIPRYIKNNGIAYYNVCI